jgi:molecular chaperone GrpE (heat shock protein)
MEADRSSQNGPLPSAEVPGGADIATALARVEAAVAAGFVDLLRELQERSTLDRFKEEQVARLHEELQAYRSDLVSQAARQLLLGIIRLHDDLGKMISLLRQRPAAELTPELFFRQFAEVQDDVEILLGQHGVNCFETAGDAFDPHRQTALRTVLTADLGQVGRVAERIRPGFAKGEMLLTKERVAVYVTDHGRNDATEGGLE